MIIGQITDFHVTTPDHPVDVRYRTAWHLERAVAHIAGLAQTPDVVLATGDLVETGSPAEYVRLRELLSPLDLPVYVIPGNHDDRTALRRAFADHAYLPREGAFLHYTVDPYPVRLVALDTVVPGQTGGALCAERLGWLAARLAEAPHRPTLILMHHPPFLTGITSMDRNGDGMGLTGADRLGAIVARHGQVERIVSGHVHRPISVRWHGTAASIAPATAHQIALDLGEGRTATVMEPPAVDLHVWLEGQGVVSHRSYIGDYPRP